MVKNSGSAVSVDIVRSALQSLQRQNSKDEQDDLTARISALRKNIDKVNDERRILANVKSSLSDALQSIDGTSLVGNPLAAAVLQLSVDALHERIAALRPDDLLEEKAALQRRLHFMRFCWEASEHLLRELGR